MLCSDLMYCFQSRSRVQSDARYTLSKLNFVDLAGSERLGKTAVSSYCTPAWCNAHFCIGNTFEIKKIPTAISVGYGNGFNVDQN